MENDRVFDLMEKMYSEMQKGFSNVNERLEKVENETSLLKNEVLKTNMKIENDLIPKIQVLFDANTQNENIHERLDNKIDQLFDRVDDLRLDINGLNMKATRTDSKLVEFDKYLRDVSKK